MLRYMWIINILRQAYNEGTPAKNLKIIGTNYDIYNNLTKK